MLPPAQHTRPAIGGRAVESPDPPITHGAVSRDLIGLIDGHSLLMIDIASGETRWTVNAADAHAIFCVFSECGRRLALISCGWSNVMGGWSNVVAVHDAWTGRCVCQWESSAHVAHFSSDGRRLAAVLPDHVAVNDAETGVLLHVLYMPFVWSTMFTMCVWRSDTIAVSRVNASYVDFWTMASKPKEDMKAERHRISDWEDIPNPSYARRTRLCSLSADGTLLVRWTMADVATVWCTRKLTRLTRVAAPAWCGLAVYDNRTLTFVTADGLLFYCDLLTHATSVAANLQTPQPPNIIFSVDGFAVMTMSCRADCAVTYIRPACLWAMAVLGRIPAQILTAIAFFV